MSAPEPLPPVPEPDWLAMYECGLPAETAEGLGMTALVPVVSHYLTSTAASERGRWLDALARGAGAVGLGAATGLAFKLFGAGIVLPALGKFLVMKAGAFGTGKAVQAAVNRAGKAAGYQADMKSAVDLAVRRATMEIEAAATHRQAGLAALKAEAQVGRMGDPGHAMFGGAAGGK